MENISKIKTHICIQQKSGKLIKEKKEFDSIEDILKEAKKIKQSIRTYMFRISAIFKGGQESSDIISWDGRVWGGSCAAKVLSL